jgi:ABC-type amino acid transport substrate-binding protein
MGAVSAPLIHRRRRRTVRWALTGVALITAVSMCACAARQGAGSATAPATPELRVGIAPIYPPLAFKQGGELVGVEVDFAHHLGQALGMQITFVETPWADLIPALRDHRIDIIMSGMSITEARQQLVSFAHPYLRVGQMMLLRRADARRLRSNYAINKPTTRIGFVSGTTGEAYVRQHLKRAQPRGFESVDAAVAALRANQIDVFVHDAPSIYSITAGTNGPVRDLVGRYEPLTEEYLAWAVRKDDDALRARLDTVLTRWNSDGTLDSVLGKWIKVRRSPRRTK